MMRLVLLLGTSTLISADVPLDQAPRLRGSVTNSSGRALAGQCRNWNHKNSKHYSSQWQGQDVASWGECCSQCGDRCEGWTFVYNGAYPGAKGQCWLKQGVGDPSTWDTDPNAISGLPSGVPATLEASAAAGQCRNWNHKNSKHYSSQWQGQDVASWGECCSQCGDRCEGWTFVYNGAHAGALGQCWLKMGVGDPSTWDTDPNTISGLPSGR